MLGNGAVPKRCFVDSVEVLFAFLTPQVVHHREFQQCQEHKGCKFQGITKVIALIIGVEVFSTGERVYHIEEPGRVRIYDH
jgi:hypothetical protein